MSAGGFRPGGGRPKGSTNKLNFRDFINRKDIDRLVKLAIKQAETKPELLKFVLEQSFGKAPQRVELTGEDGAPVGIVMLPPKKDYDDSRLDSTTETGNSTQ